MTFKLKIEFSLFLSLTHYFTYAGPLKYGSVWKHMVDWKSKYWLLAKPPPSPAPAVFQKKRERNRGGKGRKLKREL